MNKARSTPTNAELIRFLWKEMKADSMVDFIAEKAINHFYGGESYTDAIPLTEQRWIEETALDVWLWKTK